ncbi:hypothetical protein MP638_007341 [Amoeboaphelidium occidentale]|nr:hypothetical protein MP638_007341 [Amoeboaphelidium occidentale]
MRQLFVGAFHSFHKDIGAGLDNEDIALSIHEYVMLAKIRQCDLPSIEGLPKSIDTVVMQYQTNFQVYVSTTLWGRVHRWARHFKAAATYLMSCLLYEEPSEKERKRPSLQKKLVEFCKKKGLEQELDLALIDVYSILLQHTHCAGLCLNTVSVNTNWDKYFGLMWVILRQFEEYGPKDCESRAQDQGRGRGLRLFNLVPLAQIRNGFVTIDTSGLYELSRNLNINSKKNPLQSASTNIQQQPKIYVSHVQRFLANAEEEWGKKFQVTGKEWRHMSGITAAKKKRENWLKKRNDIVNANSNVPTSKVSHVSDLHNHFFYLFAHLNLWLDFYGSRQWRQLRKRSSIKRQQAHDLIVNRIIGKTERKCYLGHKGVNAKQSRLYNNVFVAFGGGQFSSTSRGHHPIPRRSLINALKQRKIPMRLVDEFRTSMLCSEEEEEQEEQEDCPKNLKETDFAQTKENYYFISIQSSKLTKVKKMDPIITFNVGLNQLFHPTLNYKISPPPPPPPPPISSSSSSSSGHNLTILQFIPRHAFVDVYQLKNSFSRNNLKFKVYDDVDLEVDCDSDRAKGNLLEFSILQEGKDTETEISIPFHMRYHRAVLRNDFSFLNGFNSYATVTIPPPLIYSSNGTLYSSASILVENNSVSVPFMDLSLGDYYFIIIAVTLVSLYYGLYQILHH